MKYRLLAGLISTSMAFGAYGGGFTDRTDRFTGNRSVRWNSVPFEAEKIGLSSYAFYPKGAETPYEYGLSLLTWADKWQFLSCHHTNWLVDGQPDPSLVFKYTHEMAGSATTESFDMTAPRSTLERLASAKLVEFSICGKEGSVSHDDIAGIQKVLDATK